MIINSQSTQTNMYIRLGTIRITDARWRYSLIMEMFTKMYNKADKEKDSFKQINSMSPLQKYKNGIEFLFRLHHKNFRNRLKCQITIESV